MEGARPCFFVNGVDIGLGSDVLSMGGAALSWASRSRDWGRQWVEVEGVRRRVSEGGGK